MFEFVALVGKLEVEFKSYSFQRELRLLKSSDFSRVFERAFKVNNKAFTLLARKNNFFYPRLGLVIAKKNLRFAHQRNYVKRLLREEFRLKQSEFDSYDIVILTRRDISHLSKPDIMKFRSNLFEKFRLRCK